jgi:hypothetical protein
MHIARFRVPGLSVQERMGLALGHILWVLHQRGRVSLLKDLGLYMLLSLLTKQMEIEEQGF